MLEDISAILRFCFYVLHQIHHIFFKNVALFLLIQPKPQPSFSMLRACLQIPIPKFPNQILILSLTRNLISQDTLQGLLETICVLGIQKHSKELKMFKMEQNKRYGNSVVFSCTESENHSQILGLIQKVVKHRLQATSYTGNTSAYLCPLLF